MVQKVRDPQTASHSLLLVPSSLSDVFESHGLKRSRPDCLGQGCIGSTQQTSSCADISGSKPSRVRTLLFIALCKSLCYFDGWMADRLRMCRLGQVQDHVLLHRLKGAVWIQNFRYLGQNQQKHNPNCFSFVFCLLAHKNESINMLLHTSRVKTWKLSCENAEMYILTYMHTCICACIHTQTYTCNHAYMRA
jgi:hypothetical protein